MEYREERTDSSFEEIYRVIYSTVAGSKDGKPYFQYHADQLKTDVNDVISEFNFTILNAVNNYDGSIDFVNRPGKPCYFKLLWKRRRTDIYRKSKRKRKLETYNPNYLDGELDDEISLIPSELNLEDEIFSKKKADQLELIDSFLSDSCDETTALVSIALTYESNKSAGRPISLQKFVAERLGIDKRTVSHKFERLAGKFDSKKYGDYSDYLVAL
ncbi:hypothetical protein J2S17_002662 [Cytobacillus purgationiresistens]|uniref:Sigma-70 family RNA polymerase sigma factor n=2 Tax=Cytobacillus purgationiresistens TaxID=863449 RepID=A0ABU0AHQ0_9BACI|nr:hypothetical protein [Cytobacillus purgationiresistens]